MLRREHGAPPAPARPRRDPAPRWFWPFVLATCVLSFLLHGYSLHGGDNDFWLPILQSAASPELYPGDPHVGLGHRDMSLHFDAFAWPVRLLGLEWTLFVAYLLAHALLFGSFAALARELLADAESAALAVLLLALPRPLGGTMTLSVESFLLPRFLAASLAVLALVLAIRRRPMACGIALGLVLLGHPLTALPAFALIALRPLLVRDGWKDAARSVSTGILVGLPLLLRHAIHRSGRAEGSLPDAEWWELARSATPFAFVDLWSDMSWLHVLGSGALLVTGLAAMSSRREALAMLPGPLAICVVGIPLTWLSGSVALIALQPTRALLFVTLLALVVTGGLLRRLLIGSAAQVLLGGMLLASLLGGWTGLVFLSLALAGITLAREPAPRCQALIALGGAALAAFAFIGPWREAALELVAARPLRLLLVASAGCLLLACPARLRLREGALATAGLALLAGLVAWVGVARVEWPWTRPAGPVAEIAAWARESTPVATRFVIPPGLGGFRELSQRTTLLEASDEGNALFSRAQAGVAAERHRRFGGEATPLMLSHEILAGEADVLVLPAGVGAPGLVPVHAGTFHSAWARPGWSP